MLAIRWIAYQTRLGWCHAFMYRITYNRGATVFFHTSEINFEIYYQFSTRPRRNKFLIRMGNSLYLTRNQLKKGHKQAMNTPMAQNQFARKGNGGKVSRAPISKIPKVPSFGQRG